MEGKNKESGTTTVGLLYDKGVVLASEKKATLGHLIESKEAKKVYPIGDRIGITTAGSVGDIQTVVRYLKAESNIFKYQKERPIKVKALASLLANILQGSKIVPYLGVFIVGGVDEKGPQVFSLDPLGGITEGDKFYSTGSGSPIALGVLEDQYEEDLSEKKAIKLALKAIKSATKRDTASGEGFSLAVIDGKGFREIEEDKIEDILSGKKE